MAFGYDIEKDPEACLSRVECGQLLYRIMAGHDQEDGWDDKEFNNLFD